MSTPTTLRAVAHPLRLQILSLLTSTELCAAEVARELDTTQANASYHLRVLAAAGLLVPAGEVRIRGGTAKRYRHPWRSVDQPGDSRAARPPVVEDQKTLIQAMASELARRATQRGAGRSQFVDAELWVDAETWSRCVDLVHESATIFHSAAKPPRTEGTIRVNMSAALFALTDPSGVTTPPASKESRA